MEGAFQSSTCHSRKPPAIRAFAAWARYRHIVFLHKTELPGAVSRLSAHALPIAYLGSMMAGRAEQLVGDPTVVTVGEPSPLTEIRTTCRCHFVRRDPQGRPRISALTDKLTDQVIDYCIPRSRIEEARAENGETGPEYVRTPARSSCGALGGFWSQTRCWVSGMIRL